MIRRLFEEVQTYRQCRIFWILLAVLFLSIFTPLAYGMYGQLVLGEPWGNKPMSDEGLIALFFFFLGIYAIVVVALRSIKMETYVDNTGIHYRSYAKRSQWQLITRDNLVSFEIRRKRRNIFEPGGIAFLRKHIGKSQYVILLGNVHIELTLMNERKVFLGTGRPEEFERAIRKMMEDNTPVYHGG